MLKFDDWDDDSNVVGKFVEPLPKSGVGKKVEKKVDKKVAKQN